MTVAGNASYGVLENAETSMVAGITGYAPPPLDNGGLDPLWEWGWAINADAANKDAAWLFVQWATSPTLMKQISPLFGVPARTSIYSDPDYLAAMPSQEFVDSQAWMLANGVDPKAPHLMSADYGLVADIISAEMNAVIAGQYDAADGRRERRRGAREGRLSVPVSQSHVRIVGSMTGPTTSARRSRRERRRPLVSSSHRWPLAVPWRTPEPSTIAESQ